MALSNITKILKNIRFHYLGLFDLLRNDDVEVGDHFGIPSQNVNHAATRLDHGSVRRRLNQFFRFLVVHPNAHLRRLLSIQPTCNRRPGEAKVVFAKMERGSRRSFRSFPLPNHAILDLAVGTQMGQQAKSLVSTSSHKCVESRTVVRGQIVPLVANPAEKR